MPIRHIVLPGGGSAGLRIMGALDKLHREGFWNYDDMESIHSVSAGSFLSVLLALRFKPEDITDYIVNRPWGNVFQLGLNNLLDVFTKKGFFDREMMEVFFKPFFDSIDLSMDTTMLKLFERTNVKLYFYTVDINSFSLQEVSHLTFPDLDVLSAVHMSAAYPIFISPVILKNKCYLDGGMICNYPINHCIDKMPKEENGDCKTTEEILSLGPNPDISLNDNKNSKVYEESTLFDFVMSMIYNMHINLYDRVVDDNKRYTLVNFVPIHIHKITLDDIHSTLTDIKYRKQLLMEGEDSAICFLEKKRMEIEDVVLPEPETKWNDMSCGNNVFEEYVPIY